VAETGSTNADLLAEARAGAPEGLVLVADHQRAGRGRQSRTWHDEPGNAMLLSALLRPALSFAPLVPLVAGLAVADAVGALVAGPNPVALKWPNDVIAPGHDDRKLAGILAEAVARAGSSDRTGPSGTATTPGESGPSGTAITPAESDLDPVGAGPDLAVVVGIGLNIRWSTPPPDEIAARSVVLEELAGRSVDRWDVVEAVLVALERWLSEAESSGPAAVLDPYRQRCATIGRSVRFETPTEVIEGVAIGVADSGGLVVARDGARVTLTAGDAHHL
jgi:BirA family biotin operon repressor/biotin-[acetyl-CoA-carboxylase] ligase